MVITVDGAAATVSVIFLDFIRLHNSILFFSLY